MRTILIIDCDKSALMEMQKQVRNVEPQAEIHCFSKGEKAMTYMDSHSFDVIFINLVVLGIQGILFAQEIRKRETKANIVFVASSYEYASDAINIRASGYLYGPVTSDKIREELKNLRSA